MGSKWVVNGSEGVVNGSKLFMVISILVILTSPFAPPHILQRRRRSGHGIGTSPRATT